MAHALTLLRLGEFVSDERARAVRKLLVAITCATILGWIATSHDGFDLTGKLLGTDFASFWTAGRMAVSGSAPSVYEPALHYRAEQAAFGVGIGYAAFFYPPPFLLMLLPLGVLPYFPALLGWLCLTGLCYARAFVSWTSGRSYLPALLAFPPVLLNVAHGQNGFLTGALLGAGALLVNKRPWLGGALLGCLVIKPHLAVLVPIALAAQGNWRGFIAAGLAATALSLAALLAFGPDAWSGFLGVSDYARSTLELGLVDLWKMQSVFASVRLFGGGVTMAYTAQALLLTGVVATIILVARARADEGAQGALLVAGALLATPFLLDYDLALAAFPLIWLASEGTRTGFRDYERVTLAVAFLWPLVARTTAAGTDLVLTPIVLTALFALIARRALTFSTSARSARARPRAYP